jgi:peroxiredoxin
LGIKNDVNGSMTRNGNGRTREGSNMKNPGAWLEAEIKSRRLTALVFFRGNWCPFCQGYLRELGGTFLSDLRAEGGDLIGITSQSEDGAQKAHQDWGLSFPTHSEPSNTLASRFGIAITPKENTPLAKSPDEYPHGMAQPGVVIVDQNGQPLVQWAIKPGKANHNGATDRPLPSVIWAALQSVLNGDGNVTLEGPRLDPAWLKANYPDAYAVLEAMMAGRSS